MERTDWASNLANWQTHSSRLNQWRERFNIKWTNKYRKIWYQFHGWRLPGAEKRRHQYQPMMTFRIPTVNFNCKIITTIYRFLVRYLFLRSKHYGYSSQKSEVKNSVHWKCSSFYKIIPQRIYILCVTNGWHGEQSYNQYWLRSIEILIKFESQRINWIKSAKKLKVFWYLEGLVSHCK